MRSRIPSTRYFRSVVTANGIGAFCLVRSIPSHVMLGVAPLSRAKRSVSFSFADLEALESLFDELVVLERELVSAFELPVFFGL